VFTFTSAGAAPAMKLPRRPKASVPRQENGAPPPKAGDPAARLRAVIGCDGVLTRAAI